MFLTIASCYTMSDRSLYSFSRKWQFTSMVWSNRREKAANFCTLIMRKVICSRARQCHAGEWPYILCIKALVTSLLHYSNLKFWSNWIVQLNLSIFIKSIMLFWIHIFYFIYKMWWWKLWKQKKRKKEAQHNWNIAIASHRLT